MKDKLKEAILLEDHEKSAYKELTTIQDIMIDEIKDDENLLITYHFSEDCRLQLICVDEKLIWYFNNYKTDNLQEIWLHLTLQRKVQEALRDEQ